MTAASYAPVIATVEALDVHDRSGRHNLHAVTRDGAKVGSINASTFGGFYAYTVDGAVGAPGDTDTFGGRQIPPMRFETLEAAAAAIASRLA